MATYTYEFKNGNEFIHTGWMEVRMYVGHASLAQSWDIVLLRWTALSVEYIKIDILHQSGHEEKKACARYTSMSKTITYFDERLIDN